MDGITVDITGVAETQRKLADYNTRLADRVTLLALRAGANFMIKAIRADTPVKTGRLRRSITLANSKINLRQRNGKIGLYIRARAGKNRADKKGAFYGQFVENGYKTKSGTAVAGRHMIKKAFTANAPAALDVIITAIESGSETLVKKLGL